MAQAAFHGNVGKVQEAQFSQDGKCRITFSVAEGHSRFDKGANQWQDTGTTWRRVTVFGKRAETLADILKEGAKQQVVVIGREETREFQKDDGTKGSSLEVVADIVGIIPTGQPAQQQGGYNSATQSRMNEPAADPWGQPTPSEPPF